MRALAIALVACGLAAVAAGAALAWPRSPASSSAYPGANTYPVARLVALLAARPNVIRGQIVAVRGYYHFGCPYCAWDAPPSLTVGPAWGGPSIMVELPDDFGPPPAAPDWVMRWRALPLLGKLAPAPPPGPPGQGFVTFRGTITPACTGAPFCTTEPFVIHVLP